MKEIKTVSVIGLGALGILFGHHLSKKMHWEDLRIVADGSRIAKYQKEGIYCNGEPCKFRYMTPEEPCEPADLLLFTVKFNSLEKAIRSVKSHVGEDTIILSALNGISSEEMIGEAYGQDKVLYCVAQGMDGIREENRLNYEHMGMLCFGDREPGIISEKARRVEHFFKKVDLPHEVETDMKKRLWGKLMMNVGVNQTVALYESNYGVIQKEGKARGTLIAAMREVMLLSEKEGILLTEEDLNYWLGVLDSLNPEGKPSMRQDLEAGRFSEVDLFSGTVMKLGEKHGIETPVNRMLYEKIKEMEEEFF